MHEKVISWEHFGSPFSMPPLTCEVRREIPPPSPVGNSCDSPVIVTEVPLILRGFSLVPLAADLTTDNSYQSASCQASKYLDLDHVQPRAMHIDITRQGERYLFHFAFYNEADQRLVVTAPARLTPEDLEDALVGIRDTWHKIAMSRTFTQGLEWDEDEFRRYIRELARAGRGLWTRLFKHETDSALYEIGVWLEEHPLKPGGILQISLAKDAADFVYPWALLYDRPVPRKEYELPDLEGFWGVRHIIEQKLPAARKGTDEPLLQGIDDGSFVYFCHSYYPRPAEGSASAAFTEYGEPFASMVWKHSLFGVQFHPEKRQAVGLRMLENFVKM